MNMARGDRLVVCFVDDDPQELKIFQDVFEDEFQILCGTRPDLALGALSEAGVRPDLFVLDLYARTQGESTREERETMIRLKMEVDAAQDRLDEYLSSIHQGPEGGLGWLTEVKRAFPRVPVVFYTRKGTLADVERCRDAGADWVLKKPQPHEPAPGRNLYDQLLEAARGRRDALARRFKVLASSRRP
jgi:DNA-binding response OmpR family regulator